MSYESPIEVILGQVQTKYENGILEAVQNCGFQIDHDELAKALMYDRNEYDKGYRDGWKEGREALIKELWEDGRDRLD